VIAARKVMNTAMARVEKARGARYTLVIVGTQGTIATHVVDLSSKRKRSEHVGRCLSGAGNVYNLGRIPMAFSIPDSKAV